MSYLARADILGAPDLPTREVPVPEWGGVVLVRGLTAAERDEYEISLIDITASTTGRMVPRVDNMRAKLAARGIVDESGNRLFSEADIEVLGTKSATALDRVCDAIRELSGLGPKAAEEALGNSRSIPDAASTTD